MASALSVDNRFYVKLSHTLNLPTEVNYFQGVLGTLFSPYEITIQIYKYGIWISTSKWVTRIRPQL